MVFTACKEDSIFADDDNQSYPEYWNNGDDENGDIYIPGNTSKPSADEDDDTTSDDFTANFTDEDDSTSSEPDSDNDGIPDGQDPDDDNDGVPDVEDEEDNGNQGPLVFF